MHWLLDILTYLFGRSVHAEVIRTEESRMSRTLEALRACISSSGTKTSLVEDELKRAKFANAASDLSTEVALRSANADSPEIKRLARSVEDVLSSIKHGDVNNQMLAQLESEIDSAIARSK
jgi:hypothetical protein